MTMNDNGLHTSHELPEHVAENRRYWDGMADDWVRPGEKNWSQESPTWGIWGYSEKELRLLPEDMHGVDAIELGCGTAYVGGWMARRGASVVGIDNSERQLSTAKRLMSEHGFELTLLHGNAESVPYPDGSFDFAISEYGAAIWCDPAKWIPEAHRLLRPGGKLTFFGTHPLAVLCTPASGDVCDARLHKSYAEIGKQDWRNAETDPGGIEFNLPFSAWLRLFRTTGFKVIDYAELTAPAHARKGAFGVSLDWARKWPAEQVWKLEKI